MPLSERLVWIIPVGVEHRTFLIKLLKVCRCGGFLWLERTVMEFWREKERWEKKGSELLNSILWWKKGRSESLMSVFVRVGLYLRTCPWRCRTSEQCRNRYVRGHYRFGYEMFVVWYYLTLIVKIRNWSWLGNSCTAPQESLTWKVLPRKAENSITKSR